MQQDPRRSSPRIGIEARCWEVVGDHEASSLVVDLSSRGVRLERPFLPVTWQDSPMIELGSAGNNDRPPPMERVVALQLEVPEIDEVMWARGDVVFDELVPSSTKGGPF